MVRAICFGAEGDSIDYPGELDELLDALRTELGLMACDFTSFKARVSGELRLPERRLTLRAAVRNALQGLELQVPADLHLLIQRVVLDRAPSLDCAPSLDRAAREGLGRGALPLRYTVGMTDKDKAFYRAWAEVLDWMRHYAGSREVVMFEKEADFPDYIYRMERPYDLPTTTMSASLSKPDGTPVLMLNASPRHTVFKEVGLHPFQSHSYRKLELAAGGEGLSEGKRLFTREMLEALADDLFHLKAEA